MKIFLSNPPWKGEGWYGVRAGSRWPFTTRYDFRYPDGIHYMPFPFFLAYAAALLEREKEDVFLIDAVAEQFSEEEFLNRACAFRPGLSLQETSTASIDVDLRMARLIKERCGTLVALCGPHVSVFPLEILRENPFVDFVFIGEYEYTLLELVRSFSSGDRMGNIRGLAWRDGSGSPRINTRRPSMKGLDALPWPARHFLPMERYIDAFCGMPQPMLQLYASRGCPYHCIFCMWPDVMYGDHKYRVRDPVDVVDEIEHCLNKYRLESFYFDDDTFNIGKKRVLQIAEEIKKRSFGVPWACMARADTMDEEMLRAMAESGLIAVKYGVESASQEILDRSGKRLDLASVEKAVSFTRKLGIRYHLTFTFGLPGETWATIRRSIEWAKELDPSSVQFSITTPFPGTSYYEELKARGYILAKSWKEYDGSGSSVIRTESLSREDLEAACSLAYEEWDKH